MSNKWTLTLCVPLLAAAVVGYFWLRAEEQPEPVEPETPTVTDDKFLPLSDRKYLWDVEHLAFVIEQKVFPRWKRALADPQLKGLEFFLAKNFQGSVPTGSGQTAEVDAAVSQTDIRHDEKSQAVVGEKFLQYLRGVRARFGRDDGDCKTSLGILRIAPVEGRNLDGPWTTTWKIRFAGWNDGSLIETWVYVRLRLKQLTEKIGDETEWIESATIERVRTVQGGKPLYREITSRTRIDVARLYDNWNQKQFRPNTGGVYLSDYNDDSILDVLIDDTDAGVILYKGLGRGIFEDVTEAAGLARKKDDPPLWTLSCWADLDGDGDEDLIAADRIYENKGDGTFRDATEISNFPLTPASGYAVGDFNNDGRIDIYVCHSGSFRPGQSVRDKVKWIDGKLGIDNVLLRNEGNWKFTDVTAETKTGGNGSACFAAVWLDANGDRRPDLFAINEFGRNSLMIQQPDGTFSEGPIDPIFGGFSMGVTAGDFDNDGFSDIYVANMYSKAGNRILSNVDPKRYGSDLHQRIVEATTGNKLYRSKGDGTFDTLSGESIVPFIGWAYGPNFVDMNMDGLPDLYVPAGFRSIKRGKPDG